MGFTARIASLITALAVTLTAPDLLAQPRPPAWGSNHRVALGPRLLGRLGDYALGGLGGQIRLRVHRLVNIELYTDHMIGTMGDALRHDHEVGGTVQLNVLGGERWSVFPMLGACASLAVARAPQDRDVSVNDIQFGLRAGVGFEYALGEGFSFEAQALALAYLGHSFDVYGWSASTSSELSVWPLGQVVLGANYYF